MPMHPQECLSIGLAPRMFPATGSQPGWKLGSIGYHGDDGRFYNGTGNGTHFGPTFGKEVTMFRNCFYTFRSLKQYICCEE